MTIVTRDTAIPFGKPTGPLRGKCLAELDDSSVEYLAGSAKEREWADAARQEQSDRAAGLHRQGSAGNGQPAPQAAPAVSERRVVDPGAAAPAGQGPGYPGATAPAPAAHPYNGGKESKWTVLPLSPGPAGLAGKYTLDTLIIATHYAFSKLLVLGWPRTNATAEAAEKMAVSTFIACQDRGIDLLGELRTANQVPPALEPDGSVPPGEDDLPF